MTDIETIQKLYNNAAEYENDRLTKSPVHELEFILTTDVLQKYIHPESRVLDLGSGPGVYSKYLINQLNCRVGLVDISEEELNLFNSKSDENILKNVDFTKVDSATDISWISDSSFDHILIQGPLYHLLDKEERLSVLSHAKRILKPNGIIFCAFISPHKRYTGIFDKNTDRIKDDKYIDNLLNGITSFSCKGVVADQFRCWPSEAEEMIEISGFKVLHVRNLEGIFSYLSPNYFPLLEDVDIKNRFIDLARSTCEEPSLLGSTLHFLIAAQKEINVILQEVHQNDLKELHQLQVDSFQSLLDKYKDFDTNPASEPLQKIEDRFAQESTTYYFIEYDNKRIGAIRVIYSEDKNRVRISPMFIIPDYQNAGLGQKAIHELERLYSHVSDWRLETILQEEKLCHFYEKLGYTNTGKTEQIKEGMDLTFYKKILT